MDMEMLALAVEQAKLAQPNDRSYCVGCVITEYNTNRILSRGYTREMNGNTHAEECALMKMDKKENRSLTMYTTMEPCSTRLSGNKSCTERILEYGKVKRVVIGMNEPDTFVVCKGTSLLVQEGITVDAIGEMEAECALLNTHV